MAVAVRPVRLDEDRRILVEFLGKNLTAVDHGRRFDWLYLKNPAGEAWAWFIVEQKTEEVVGAASLFPRAVWIGEKVKRCGQVGDFAIDARYRSLGPALLLQRATFAPVDEGRIEFCYDCPPHDLGMATFKRLGIKVSCPMVAYARLLRADRQVVKLFGSGLLGRSVARAANWLLSMKMKYNRKVRGVEIARHAAPFGEEFTILDNSCREEGVIRTRRTAADLNWRYRDDPETNYDVLTARRGGELEAYLVFVRRGDDSYVIDLFGGSSWEVHVALLEAAAQLSHQSCAHALRMFVPAQSPSRQYLASAGQSYRDNAMNVVAYAVPSNPLYSLLIQSCQWNFSYADVLA